MYNFGLLDPRPGEAAEEINRVLLGPVTIGIEITIPELAVRCGWGNIDPQHSSGEASGKAAIEVALEEEPPPQGAKFVTIRADLDAVGAMAIFAIRASGVPITSEALDRIRLVAESDKFARGGWPGSKPLPTKENPWSEKKSARPLAAIAAAVGDFKALIADRVDAMQRWLATGEEPAGYRERVETERADLIRAIEDGRIKAGLARLCTNCWAIDAPGGGYACPECGYSVETEEDPRLAVVVSSHRAATSVGYSLAPVVVAMNPEFRVQDGPAHTKFTVAQFTQGHVDLKAALAELAFREPGWGGTPTIIGSPQGVSSKLTLQEVVEVVRRHLV